MTQQIVWLDTLEPIDRQWVGGKAMGLLELTKLGLPVPPGFVLTTAFFATDQTTSIAYWQEQISTAYQQLGEKMQQKTPAVAVRSSAIAEDGEQHSFAGLHDTFLWICGQQAVREKVQQCQNSLFSTRATAYRATLEANNGATAVPQMAVIVQAMVPARASGVMMTLNPSNGDRSKVVIESTWGLGQLLVDGSVIPDRFLLDKVTQQLIETAVAHKTKQMQPAPDNTISEVTLEQQDLPSLSEAELSQLVMYGRLLENHFGTPQDIEFATTQDGIYILQTRPETAWTHKQHQPHGLKAKPIDNILNMLTNFGGQKR